MLITCTVKDWILQPDLKSNHHGLQYMHTRYLITLHGCAQAVFLLIGKTSALTMNIAGVIKDWLLIFFSYYLFGAPVTALNLLGYAFCCTGVLPSPTPLIILSLEHHSQLWVPWARPSLAQGRVSILDRCPCLEIIAS